jgi:anti-sigma-K factor RskA
MANYALQPDDQLAHKGQQPPIGLTTTPKQPRRWYFGRALATAAATLLLVLNGALLWQNQQLQSQQASLATDLAEQNQALILLAAEEPQEIEIFDPEGLSTARADILWNNSLRLAVVYVRDFPQCESGMKYQLWLTKNGERRSGGLFSVDASGMGLLVVPLEQSIDAYDVIGITPEPAGGSPGPTAPPIVRGEI